MTRTKTVINSIREMLENEKCKKAQVLAGTYKDDFCIKVGYLDTPKFKDKVANLIEERYCESVRKVKEGKTYIVYAIATREQLRNELHMDPEYMKLKAKIDKYVRGEA